ncbi:MAG: hypothetical protein ABI581_10600 [Sediminibacterium sp.]
MKKSFLISTAILLIAFTFYSCKKDAATNIITEEQAVQELLQTESFADFSKSFIPDVTNLMRYHRSIKVQDKAGFLNQVSMANDDEPSLINTYRSFSLDYEAAMELKNKIDNDLLRLFNKNKFLLGFTENQTRSILLTSLEAAMRSEDPKWKQVKLDINDQLKAAPNRIALQSIRLNLVDPGTGTPDLSWDEVWDCLKSAVGFGTAGVLGIAALQKLAQEGVQEVIIKLSKFLAKRAGWFGLAIMIIDFSSCLYKESND